MTYCLVGSRGRLGQAIAKTFSHGKIICLERSIYQEWSHSGRADRISTYFESTIESYSTILVASGLLDPNTSSEDLISINYTLPRNIIDGATKLGFKVITFGTVMEGLLNSKNSYVRSKTLLNEYIQSLTPAKNPVTHIQLHTLYGLGEASPFMFLGQILYALINNVAFRMTSGYQLREYHHFLDEAKAIQNICGSEITGVVNLSHGKPVSLRDIAQQVFLAFGKEGLLEIGTLPEPTEENYDKFFQKSNAFNDVTLRDTLPAIANYMKACYSSEVRK